MLLPPPFPISVDQLDTAFLGAALDLPVTGFTTQRIGADRGMLGEIFVLDLDTSEGTRSIVAKFAALREEALTTARQGRTNERELRCYDELLATSGSEYRLYSNHDDYGQVAFLAAFRPSEKARFDQFARVRLTRLPRE